MFHFNTNLGTFQNMGMEELALIVSMLKFETFRLQRTQDSSSFYLKSDKTWEKASGGRWVGGLGKWRGGWRIGVLLAAHCGCHFLGSEWLVRGRGRSSHTEYPITTPHHPRLSCKPPPYRLFHGQIYLIRSESYLTKHSTITDSGSVE